MRDEKKELEKLLLQMPPKYRYPIKLLLKLPEPTIPFYLVRRFPTFEGIFHGILMPLFVFMSGVLTLWLFPMTSLTFGFPLNILITLLIPTTILTIFARVQLQRTIDFWHTTQRQQKEWKVSETASELVELFKKQQRSDKSEPSNTNPSSC